VGEKEAAEGTSGGWLAGDLPDGSETGRRQAAAVNSQSLRGSGAFTGGTVMSYVV